MTNNSKISHRSEIEVLNQLLTAQAILHVFPDENKIGEYIVEVLNTIPGVMGTAICLRRCTCVSGIPESEISSIKESIKNIAEEQNHFSVNIPEKAKRIVLSLQTIERLYGYVFISIENNINFENYKSAINNFINIVALELENRRQKAQLLTQQFQLEETVKKKADEINKRKYSEKKIKESEEKYRFIFDGAKDGIIHIEKNLKVLNVNPAFTEITSISKESIIGKSGITLAKKFVNTKQLPFILNYLRTIAKDKPISEYELFYQDKILLISSSKQENGQRVAIIRDITKRKKAEQELKESEERYKGIIQNTNGCIAVYKAIDKGKDFVFVDFNPSAEKAENISKESVLGKKVTEVFPGVKEFGLFEVFQEVWKTGKAQHFPVSVYKDDRIRGYRENYVYKLSSGEIVAVYHDLTEQKLAEEKVAKSELKFRLLASNTYDWEYWVDQDGKYVFISDSCEEISGYSAADFYENHELLYNLVHPDYTEMVKTHYHSEDEKETPKSNMEFPIINRNGDLRWIEHNCTPVFDEKGNFKGRRGNNRDVTERKKTDELLKDAEDRFRTLFNQSPDGILINDPENLQPIFFNDSACKILGYSKQEFSKLRVNDFEILDSVDVILRRKDKILREGSDEFESKYKTKSGKIIDVLVRIQTFQYSGRLFLNVIFSDITERKQTERLLRESEQKFKDLTTLLPLIVYEHDINGELTFANNKASELLGYSPDDLKKGFNVFQAIIPEERERVKDSFQKLMKGKKTGNRESVALRKDGSTFPILIYSVVIIKDNIRVGVRGVIVDITERKQAEEALKESEERYKSIVQDQSEIISRFDKNNKYIFVNDVFCRFFDKSRDELIGHKWFPDANKDDVETINDKLKTLSKSNPFVLIENRVYSGKGELHWFQFINRGIYDQHGDLLEIQSVGRDITEQKKAEEMLIKAEEHYRLLTENSLDIIWQVSFEGKYLYISHSVEKIMGYTVEEALQLTMEETFTPESYKYVLSRLEYYFSLAKDERPLYSTHQLEQVCKDGSTILTELIIGVLYDKAGAPIGYQGSTRDITERKQAEEKIKKAHKQLEELYKHQNEIRENERKAISREIHDELGQLLTALKIDLYYTMDNMGKTKDVTNKISGMIDIVSDTIKTVQRISSELRPSLLDDLGLVPAIEWYVQEFEKRTNIKCRLELEDIDFSDQRKYLALYRIVQEAFTNIIRHANAQNVQVKFYKKGDKVTLKITDDGIGMKPDKISSSKSLGFIGITERVKQYNGRLVISSELGKGTEIRVVIPFEGDSANNG